MKPDADTSNRVHGGGGARPDTREPTPEQRLEWVATALHGDPLFGRAASEPLVQQIAVLRTRCAGSPEPTKQHLTCDRCGYGFQGWTAVPKLCPNDGQPLRRAASGGPPKPSDGERTRYIRESQGVLASPYAFQGTPEGNYARGIFAYLLDHYSRCAASGGPPAVPPEALERLIKAIESEHDGNQQPRRHSVAVVMAIKHAREVLADRGAAPGAPAKEG